jgi:adenylosuccinate synthase
MAKVNNVDVVCGLSWGDEAKGKIVGSLCLKNKYDFVCRWAGGSNAGHTIYIDGKKYNTNIVPCGIFFGITSIIGPDCLVNMNDLNTELEYLKNAGFDTSLVKISPRAHVITSSHKEQDAKKYQHQQGSTGKGIAPCAGDKYARVGTLFKDGCLEKFKESIWDEDLYGDVLCEGAQGYWLDINIGNYPFVTSSNTLPYSSCSLGFPPQKIREIYGAAKVYDTRVGVDPFFDDENLTKTDIEIFDNIGEVGGEYGTTTGRSRKVRWLNMKKLVTAINVSGTTTIIISKMDVLEEVNMFYLKHDSMNTIFKYDSSDHMKRIINEILNSHCPLLKSIIYSDNPFNINF